VLLLSADKIAAFAAAMNDSSSVTFLRKSSAFALAFASAAACSF
jgi:hypothetical protein